MVDSVTLRLYHASRAFQASVADALTRSLEKQGYRGLGAGQLRFLAELDCGANHAAELARRTGVTRQAVHKQVKDLVAQGILEYSVDEARRNQNVITFTAAGIELMAECRRLLAKMDDALNQGMGRARLSEAIGTLNGPIGPVA